MLGSMEKGSTSSSTMAIEWTGNSTLQPKYEVFLSHSGAQKGFVDQLRVDLERCGYSPFFDKLRECLPIGEDFPKHIFDAIKECEVGVVVLSEEFFTSKWPMKELVKMTNVKKKKSSFTIMPILLGLSLSDCRDKDNQKRWLSLWHSWAECDSRIDLRDWNNVFQLFGPTNALQYNIGLGEVKYREEIVEAICRAVPPRTQFEDSYIQGRSRLCKVIHERIKQSKVSSTYGVHVIGLHGFGGIGKTTLCKAMCNALFGEYCGKVAHMELGSGSKEELLKEVLRRLTNMNLERWGPMTVDQYSKRLKSDMKDVKVFLTIDNVSSATSDQALTVLKAKYGLGSVVLVTARSLDELTSLGILPSECMEMPELEMEEARSLFLNHATSAPRANKSNKDDYELVSACIQRCYFKKGDGKSSHYHPLALQALGRQLGRRKYAPEQWRSLLDEIDFLNISRRLEHPVFSILRTSFDALPSQDQLLFMDVALFGPDVQSKYQIYDGTKWNVFEWFGKVHNISTRQVIEWLKNLKRESLLEDLGDGFNKINMHDLWRQFARLETKAGKFEERQWMFEWDEFNTHDKAHKTNGSPLANVSRMFFLEKGFVKLKDVSFLCFPSLTVLKLNPQFGSLHELDLSGLEDLKSLELDYIDNDLYRNEVGIYLSGLGSLLKLFFLRWSHIPSESPCIDEIGHLTNLQVLELDGGDRVPNLSNLLLLQVVSFRNIDGVATIVGFNSKHTKLKFLDLSTLWGLESCPGVGELDALQELCLNFCQNLKDLPNLQKLKQLRKLDVSQCLLLRGLPGLGDLVSLVELLANGCKELVELLNIRNLRNLKVLDIGSCKRIKSLPGLNELVCLQSLSMLQCDALTQLPNIDKLTNLQNLEFGKRVLVQSSMGHGDLISLEGSHIPNDEVQDGLDLCKFSMLESLYIVGWQGQGFLSIAELVSLEKATIHNCKGIHVLPNLQKLSRLVELDLEGCEFEDMSGLSHLTNLEWLIITECDKLKALPDLQELANLKILILKRCVQLVDVCGIVGLRNSQKPQSSWVPHIDENCGPDHPPRKILRVLLENNRRFTEDQRQATSSQLDELVCKKCPIQEFPDLAHFPKLSYLNVAGCVNLTNLTCTGPMSSTLKHLDVSRCEKLQALPDLTNSSKMAYLDVFQSGIVLNAPFIKDMKVRWPFMNFFRKNEDEDSDFDGITEDNNENDDEDFDEDE